MQQSKFIKKVELLKVKLLFTKQKISLKKKYLLSMSWVLHSVKITVVKFIDTNY